MTSLQRQQPPYREVLRGTDLQNPSCVLFVLVNYAPKVGWLYLLAVGQI
jgi:hypothetical protein